MKMYWLYDLPTWLSGSLIVVAFVAFGLAGLYLTRGWVRRLDSKEHHAYNHIVGFYIAGVPAGHWSLGYLFRSAGKGRS
jgi:hypothetical protein